ncbi:MAG: toll/interleukin-1 receptor domain-containing protein [Gemmatimonadales bacterium]
MFPLRHWDGFISYKSRNVEVARALGEQLVASGRRIWFAEHQILLVDRDRFQEAIDRGIARSRWGIALTNDAYVASPYCEREMELLLRHVGPGRILEIRIPAEARVRRRFPALARTPSMEYTGDLSAVLGFIARHTGWRLHPPPPIPPVNRPDVFRGECLGVPFTLDVSGWTLRAASFQGGGPLWGRTLDGWNVQWNLQYGEELDPQVYDARRRANSEDERVLYNNLCEYADNYFRYLGRARVGGVHLLLKTGASHFAISYRRALVWHRRYSVILVDPGSYRAAEFLFTFRFHGPFRPFCRIAAQFDALVHSLRWGETGAEETPPAAPASAPERFARLIDDQPAANKLFDQGMRLLKKGRLEEGSTILEQVMAYSIPAEMAGAVLFNLGRAREKLGDLDGAVAGYESAVEANPAQFNAMANLGAIYHRMGALEEAIAWYERALTVNRDDRITLHNLALCRQDLERASGAS